VNEVKTSRTQQILAYAKDHPTAKPADIAEALTCSVNYVYAVQWKAKQKALKKPKGWRTLVNSPNRPIQQIEMFEPKADPVNHPAHYKVGGIETIDFIEAKKLNYNIGNVIKYLTRADHKGSRKQDLQKALWYLNRELSSLT
jgi:hypothetical protein